MPNLDKSQEHEIGIDTSKMSKGQTEALEVTEAARAQTWSEGGSFVADLFMGKFDFKAIFPFPEQSPEEKKIGDDLIATLSKYLAENLDPDEVDKTGKIPQKVIDDLVAMGIFAIKIPQKYGGLGLSQVNYNRVMSLIASFCASTAVLVSAHQSIGLPQPLKMCGTPEQQEKYFPRFRQGSISAFALTEPDVGSDPARMTTEAKPIEDGKFYLINGIKQWITNAPIADLFVVMAKTPPKIVAGKEKKQISAFIVEKSMPGVEVAQRCEFMGLAGMENGMLKLTNVKVPKENMLFGEGRGLKMALSTLNIGRLTLPAAGTGAAKQCLSIARRFASKREQWGKPVGEHEFGRQKLAFMASTVFAMEAVTWIASDFADRPEKDIRLEAAMSKLFCSEAAWKIADTTVQLCGGRGYEKALSLKARGEIPYPVERIMRDGRINTIIEGTSEIMHLFIAREAMDPHFKIAGKLLLPKAPILDKIKAIPSLLFFYCRWYSALLIKSCFSHSYNEMGALAKHLRFVEINARKLARTLFHAMARHQTALEKRQIILGHMVEIGMELFAIAAACSYAKSLQDKNQDTNAFQVADYFCCQARRRVEEHFASIKNNDNKKQNALAKEVLDKKLDWLEKEIIWIGPKT